MNTEEKTERQEKENKKEKNEIQITIGTLAEMKVSNLLDCVNDGFELGRVSRKDLASYLLLKAVEKFNDEDVVKVRGQTLTDLSLLEYELKQARETGFVPEDLREFLRKKANLALGSKKSKKTGQNKNSNAICPNVEAD
ncbi:MAG TPA: hypothetical protein VIG33_03025 [Pseudobdellovibrionaceae bacterium]